MQQVLALVKEFSKVFIRLIKLVGSRLRFICKSTVPCRSLNLVDLTGIPWLQQQEKEIIKTLQGCSCRIQGWVPWDYEKWDYKK